MVAGGSLASPEPSPDLALFSQLLTLLIEQPQDTAKISRKVGASPLDSLPVHN